MKSTGPCSFLCSVLFFLIAASVSHSQPGCLIFSSPQGHLADTQNDDFYRLMVTMPSCPQNIDDLGALLSRNFQNRKFLVANRGRNNPKMGSFSVFESFSSKNKSDLADAGIFLGHFTHLKSQNGIGVIDLDQQPDKGKLVIELIAWDASKGYYNFYELIGQGAFNQWFYRGDSRDILLDNQSIYLNTTPQKPPIGQTLRCSGCHISGGPIMKEMAFPHNDWWTKSRPLVFENQLSEPFLQRLRVIDSAENLSRQVQAGILKLQNSASYQNVKASLGIRTQLRPLFCDLEINIESDPVPSGATFPLQALVQIPSSALVGPLMGTFKFQAPSSAYSALLQKYRLQFPENGLPDADHAWLTPVKGYSDLVAISKLKILGLVDDKTILDIYFSSQVGSLMNKDKCNLLKLVPNSTAWRLGFLQNLKARSAMSSSAVAKSLYEKMNNPELTPMAYQKALKEWYGTLTLKIAKGDIESLFTQLLVNRASVFDSEISKNPRGQILEPGFRVIFPQPHSPVNR